MSRRGIELRVTVIGLGSIERAVVEALDHGIDRMT